MIEQLASFINFQRDNVFWVGEIAVLFITPFANEDFAIIIGGFAVATGSLPTFLVFGSIYSGIIASDILLYGIGIGARYVPYLNKLAEHQHIKQLGKSIKFNTFITIIFCRFVPGVVFIALIHFGLTRVSFFRFIASSLIVSAVYLTLMLSLVVLFGEAFQYYFGLWTWPAMFLIFVMVGLTRGTPIQPEPFVLETQRHLKWRAFDMLEQILMILGAIMIAGFTLTVACDVVTSMIGHPWSWLKEATMTFFIYGVFIGTAAAIRRNDHLYLGVLAETLSGNKRLVLEISVRGVVLAVALSMIYHGYLNFLDGFHSLRMPSMTPLSTYYAAIPLCGVLVALFMIEQLVNGWHNGFPEPKDKSRPRHESLGSEGL